MLFLYIVGQDSCCFTAALDLWPKCMQVQDCKEYFIAYTLKFCLIQFAFYIFFIHANQSTDPISALVSYKKQNSVIVF